MRLRPFLPQVIRAWHFIGNFLMQSPSIPQPSKLLRPKELAAELGVSLNSVYNWIREKHIPVAEGHKPVRLCLGEVLKVLSGKAQLVNFRCPHVALRPPQHDSEWITAAQAASLLRVPPVTIYRWAQKDILSHQIVGSRYLFRRRDVVALTLIDERNEGNLMAPKEAARVLRVSVSWVRRKIQAGNLKAVRFGQRYLIPMESLETLKYSPEEFPEKKKSA